MHLYEIERLFEMKGTFLPVLYELKLKIARVTGPHFKSDFVPMKDSFR